MDRFFMNRSQCPALPVDWKGEFEDSDLFLVHLVMGAVVDEDMVHEALRGAAEAASLPMYMSPHKLEWHTTLLKDKAIQCMNSLMDLKSSTSAEIEVDSPEQPDSKKALMDG